MVIAILCIASAYGCLWKFRGRAFSGTYPTRRWSFLIASLKLQGGATQHVNLGSKFDRLIVCRVNLIQGEMKESTKRQFHKFHTSSPVFYRTEFTDTSYKCIQPASTPRSIPFHLSRYRSDSICNRSMEQRTIDVDPLACDKRASH